MLVKNGINESSRNIIPAVSGERDTIRRMRIVCNIVLSDSYGSPPYDFVHNIRFIKEPKIILKWRSKYYY